MPISSQMPSLEKQASEPLHGLVALKSTRRMKTGATRSIRLAAPVLRDQGVHLHFASVRSVAHTLLDLARTGRFLYDFVLFNGLGSISSESRFGFGLWRTALALRIPTFLYWHETKWVLERQRKEDATGARTADRIASHPSLVHLTASEACSQSIHEFYPSARTKVVYECSSVPAPFDHPVKPADPPTVINVASIQERKGTDLFVETAIKVCQRHPTVEFIWLGNGRTRGSWQANIEAAGLEHRILFPGYVESPYLLLRRASVFFLSSRDDPFPLSNLEAMCLGRTVVAFDVGGAPEALAGHGRIIHPFDTDAAAQAILECLCQQPEELVSLELRDRYLALYTPERFARRIANCIREQIAHE